MESGKRKRLWKVCTSLWIAVIVTIGQSSLLPEVQLRLRMDWRMGESSALWHGSPLFLRLEIHPRTWQWRSLYFVDSVGSQLLPPKVATLRWEHDSLGQVLIFVFSPQELELLPRGQYQLRCEAVDVQGRRYVSNAILLEYRQFQPDRDRWRERWRNLLWLELNGELSVVDKLSRHLQTSSPSMLLQQLALVYLHRKPVRNAHHPIQQLYQQEWEGRFAGQWD